ncbi:MAG TPA: hypothetical protein VFS67_05815 [Polyangiaceae bacterium]|nr:hypothetical protein [Polyangiaceae bacterium]
METPDLLPDLPGRGELVRRYAHLLHHFGKEIGSRPLVRQNAEFFPDRFDKDAPSVERLVRRLQTHAGLLDVPIGVRVLPLELAEAGTNASKSCGSGACGTGCGTPSVSESGAVARLEEHASGWTLNVFDAELHHPVALTTQLALALAEIFLSETSSAQAPVEAPRGVSRDLACVALGLGSLVLEGSYIYSKSCGGPSVTRLTELSVGELAIAQSLFIALRRVTTRRSGRGALSELSTTQRALLGEANDWAHSNASLVAQLAANPGQLATRAPQVREARSWLLRVFERSPAAAAADELPELPLDLPAQAVPQRAPRPRTREQEELAALVEEALRG